MAEMGHQVLVAHQVFRRSYAERRRTGPGYDWSGPLVRVKDHTELTGERCGRGWFRMRSNVFHDLGRPGSGRVRYRQHMSYSPSYQRVGVGAASQVFQGPVPDCGKISPHVTGAGVGQGEPLAKAIRVWVAAQLDQFRHFGPGPYGSCRTHGETPAECAPEPRGGCSPCPRC